MQILVKFYRCAVYVLIVPPWNIIVQLITACKPAFLEFENTLIPCCQLHHTAPLLHHQILSHLELHWTMPVVVKKQNLVVEINYVVPIYRNNMYSRCAWIKKSTYGTSMYIDIQQYYVTAQICNISWQPIFMV